MPSIGRIQKGFKSSVNRMNIEEQKKLLTMKSTTSLSSVASGEGGRPTAEGRPTVGRKAMGNLPDDEQEAHARPTGWEEVAQHTEIPSFNPGGK